MAHAARLAIFALAALAGLYILLAAAKAWIGVAGFVLCFVVGTGIAERVYHRLGRHIGPDATAGR